MLNVNVETLLKCSIKNFSCSPTLDISVHHNYHPLCVPNGQVLKNVSQFRKKAFLPLNHYSIINN